MTDWSALDSMDTRDARVEVHECDEGQMKDETEGEIKVCNAV